MDWLRDHAWEAWLGLAVLFGVLELISMDLFLVMLAGGALVGAVTASAVRPACRSSSPSSRPSRSSA